MERIRLFGAVRSEFSFLGEIQFGLMLQRFAVGY